MRRSIVIFERDERYTSSGIPELDFRLVRQSLPAGSSPLCIANQDGFAMSVECGQWFTEDEIIRFAEEQSGFSSTL